ncbi:LOW QUALITY PROTEIN: myosin heavy chain kinase B-like [Xenia sp. Carnegie-2017]|uniref:LOW QUALITY PROTEIN: myosin heavy chain kinase B-like n=1 Tax=Xenia sp. Carnegie-2017 TaxID=2897299 RepID=UPI001F045C12|nr:LOW QUALITY PROTEIN: myosin heavy chain kinase B-like [Xenia sp. Carnegie-2017]
MSVEEHTCKVVQMHLLARNFALQLKETVKNDKTLQYGKVLEYQMIYFGKTNEDKYVTIEEYIPGEFTKYLNNTGMKCVPDLDILGQKAESLTHYSFEKSEKKLMVVDIQGNGHKLFDPEIASSDLFDNSQKLLFSIGNLVTMAHDNFLYNHKCNELKPLVLKPFTE